MAKKTIMAIDPGTTESGYAVWDGQEILEAGKVANDYLLLHFAESPAHRLVIEQIRCMGMAVGASTLDTVFWSGRFAQEWYHVWGADAVLLPRMDVKMHICGNSRAKDGNIIQALVDRFADGEKNRGKGTKKAPGFFYGFRADMWQAFALAVTYYDKEVSCR